MRIFFCCSSQDLTQDRGQVFAERMNDPEKGGLEKARPGFSIYLNCGAHEVVWVAGKHSACLSFIKRKWIYVIQARESHFLLPNFLFYFIYLFIFRHWGWTQAPLNVRQES